jgi:hypothetical protein
VSELSIALFSDHFDKSQIQAGAITEIKNTTIMFYQNDGVYW